jgi:hypothetical protein
MIMIPYADLSAAVDRPAKSNKCSNGLGQFAAWCKAEYRQANLASAGFGDTSRRVGKA